MSSTPPLTVRIESLAYGGEGVATLPSGKKVFVAGTAPGDLVAIALTQERPQFARARVLAVHEPGGDRVAPRCRHAGQCGGCQLQHVGAEAQRRAKEAAFYDGLRRLGGVRREEIPDARAIVAAAADLAYRSRCRLRVQGRRIGFCGWRSNDVVDLAECPVLVPPLEELALATAAALRARPVAGLRDLHLCVGDDGAGAAALFLEGAAGAAPLAAADALLAGVPGLRGVVVVAAGGAPRLVGDPVVATAAPHAPGVRLLLRPDLFAQANPAVSALLVGLAVELLAPRPHDAALDLYAGAGNFTFALAARAGSTLAVEEAGPALALLERAAAAAGAMVRVETRAGDAVRVCGRLAAEGRPADVAIMDPPRQGAKELPAALAALGPRRIVYVSCDPATLARDVKALRGRGYAVAAAVPVDMFPQTYHIEGLVLLVRE
ncbi:MAG TPA: TRAM domain-containing protein [Polyangia bacterium]|jgi:23S rRNA (uracil1939-C5)-methyltransferase